MSLVDALRWAAGGRAELPDATTYDDDALVESIRYHGLAGRALRRLRHPPVRVTPWLLDALRDVHAEARRDWERKLRLLSDLRRRSLAPADTLVLKGPTAYALTADAAVLRASADVDLLSPAPDALLEDLRREGFETVAPNAPYELASLHRDGVFLELHRYYPAFAFPDDLDTSDAAPRRHPGQWRFRGGFGLRRVRHRDVVAAATHGVAPGTRGLLFADAAMAALVVCCHVFNSYHFGARPPRVRLGELADVVRLRRHPRFSPVAFARLVRDHGARDAVALVDELAACTLGTAPFSNRSGRAGDDVDARGAPCPQDLWWSHGRANFLVATRPAVSVDDLLLRRVDAGRLVRYMGATPLPASRDRATPLSPARVLVHTRSHEPLRPSVAAVASATGLSLHVLLPHAAAPGSARVLCNLGHRVVELTPARHRPGALPAGARPARARCVQRGATIALELPWDALDARVAARRDVPMLLGVRVAQGDAFTPEASTLVPLVVRLPG